MRSVTRIRLPAAALPVATRPSASSSTRRLSQVHLQCQSRLQHPSPAKPQQRPQAPPPSSSLRPRPFCTSTATAAPLPSSTRAAQVVPMYGQGPPPDAPQAFAGQDAAADRASSSPSSSAPRERSADPAREAEERLIRISRRRALAAKTSASDSKRFWKTTGVAEDDVEGGGGTSLQVRLDARPLRHPTTKQVIRLPSSKRLLAHALAVEWDQLASVRQATQGHRVPLTSLVCRAVDLEDEAASASEQQSQQQPQGPLRAALIENLLRYLDTDSLLCWAPPDEVDALHGRVDPAATRVIDGREISLRQLQEETAGPILAYLATHVWPGVVVEPVLGAPGQENILFPKPHPPETRAAVGRWLEGLSGWDLAGVERATLAGKSLVVAARLVAGWSPTATTTAQKSAETTPGGISVEDAVAATNMETAFQTAQWGEVEDTHDVDREDMRRHFGSVVLLVS